MDRRGLVIAAAFLLDALIGDPQNPLHPVRLIGAMIGAGIKLRNRLGIRDRTPAFLFGLLLSCAVVAACYAGARLLLFLCAEVHALLGLGAEILLCYFIVSARALCSESTGIRRALEAGDLDLARRRLSLIVGRDTERLSPGDIVRAAVETVSENLTDGVAAPLFFTLLGGVPLGVAYKAVNTLDSMLGYRSEAFEYFGKFPARLDDAAGFLPARLAAAAMLLIVPFTGLDFKNAVRVFRRDRYNHRSPNSAQTEAVCAGALGLRLGGGSFYGGKFVEKPYIGDALREPEARHIALANRLTFTSSALLALLMALPGLFWRLLHV